jgi:molecular chaperone IbpA
MTTHFAFELPPTFHRHAIGFDRLFADMSRTFANSKDNYPPYNVIKVDDTHMIIEVAVAGFAKDEIAVELKESTLSITGKKAEKSDAEFIHRGISARNFERVFTLGDHLEVSSAKITNGILAIELEQLIPEEKKPKKVDITE